MFGVSALLAMFIPGVASDPTMKSGLDTSSAAYRQYREFVKHFGHEEFTLVAIKNVRLAEDPRVLNTLRLITQKIETLDHVTDVLSLSNLRIFQERDGRFGSYPFLRTRDHQRRLPEQSELKRLRQAVPVLDFLVSKDLKTVGVVIRIDARYRFDLPLLEKLHRQIRLIVEERISPSSEYRIIGPAMIRLAIQRYNVQTALIFGILCLAISTAVSGYIFKNLKVTLITAVVMGLCVLWILGLMSLSRIPLNSTTGLSFGLVLIVSVALVIRIVTHFNERYKEVKDRKEASRQALRMVFLPCLICSATTAVGFGSIMVSTIPMVFQLGLIMSLGVMLSFVLAIILTPAFLVFMKPLDPRSYQRMATDWVAVALTKMEQTILRHSRSVTVAGIVFSLVMLAGIPFIQSDTQILRMLSDTTDEIKDIEFVEQNLTNVHSLEIMIQAEPGTFGKPEAWERVAKLTEALHKIPEVVVADSFLSLLQYLEELFQGPNHKDRGLFSKPGLIPQLLLVTSFSPEGQLIRARYLDDKLSRLHISVRIRNSPDVPITETIEHVQNAAESAMGGIGRVMVTGDIAVFAAQASELVRSQLLSLTLAFVLITGLLMLSLGSVALGLVSLISNVPPVAMIFGLMGWLGISLDTVTVFAATVALGLAVDDTIHYLIHLKNQTVREASGKTVEQCALNAFEITAKAMVSTSTILFAGFLVLVVSPFSPVISFGILGSAAILTAVLGDVVFLPSVILSSSTIKRIVAKHMRQEHNTTERPCT